jgi:hypothetical protein
MVIPDEMRKCVVFIGFRVKPDDSFRPCGSAFWVVRPRPHFPKENIAYMVTAAHVVKGMTDRAIDTITLRVNFTGGSCGFIDTKAKNWTFHDDPTADIAVLSIGFNTAEHDHRAWPMNWTASSEKIKEYGIGPGDELFFIGMFARHFGTTMNIPIVRMGNIAAMPFADNPIQTKVGPVVADLAEARSIGGLSGSPVFIDIFGSMRRVPFPPPHAGLQFLLLGLIHGHYDEAEDSTDNLADDGIRKTKINMGIAVVIPVERIAEVLEKFSPAEEQDALERLKKLVPIEDNVRPSNDMKKDG